MVDVKKRPIVVPDLIQQATYVAENQLDAAERFLVAAEDTFNQLGKMPQLGKQTQFSNPRLLGIRQYPVSGFKNHLIFYRNTSEAVEILRIPQFSS